VGAAEDLMLERMECYDRTHHAVVPRPLAEWRVTLDNDGQEFDCTSCFEWRLSMLQPFTPITIVRIRGYAAPE
jgi:hypothetical protein